MTEQHNDAPHKTFRLSRGSRRHASGSGESGSPVFPQLKDQLRQAADIMREMDQTVPAPVLCFLPGWTPGTRVRHKQHPEYGTGTILRTTSGGLSAYCRFDQFSISAEGWTPSGYYRLSQLEVVRVVDIKERIPL
ncbi:hypothetical protein ACTHPF_11310 [Paenibacillus sp. SAF-054]|uniref:hypothetical protein n=1 Tax=unclassified Paenibacillus TaxID=185978 RepID=UPI003F823C48